MSAEIFKSTENYTSSQVTYYIINHQHITEGLSRAYLTHPLDLTSPANKRNEESPIREKSIQGLKPSLGTANCIT